MTAAPQRQILLTLLDEAVNAGARFRRACAQIGLSWRTAQRWMGQHSASTVLKIIHCHNGLTIFSSHLLVQSAQLYVGGRLKGCMPTSTGTGVNATQ